MKAAQAELEKAFAGTKMEKALRLSLENQLSEMKKMHEGNLDMALVLEEKDRSGVCPCDAPIVIRLAARGGELFPSFRFPSPFSACSRTEKARGETRVKGKGMGWRSRDRES